MPFIFYLCLILVIVHFGPRIIRFIRTSFMQNTALTLFGSVVILLTSLLGLGLTFLITYIPLPVGVSNSLMREFVDRVMLIMTAVALTSCCIAGVILLLRSKGVIPDSVQDAR